MPTPPSSLHTSTTHTYTGAALAVALNLIWQFDLPSWLLVPLLASAATLVGLLYPYVIGENYADAPDTSKVMRCVAVSVGIYQATIVSLYGKLDTIMGSFNIVDCNIVFMTIVHTLYIFVQIIFIEGSSSLTNPKPGGIHPRGAVALRVWFVTY